MCFFDILPVTDHFQEFKSVTQLAGVLNCFGGAPPPVDETLTVINKVKGITYSTLYMPHINNYPCTQVAP